MQSLRDYLNHTRQCESILNPDQNQVMSRMTDDMIRSRIREYCTYDLRKYRGEQWTAANYELKIDRIDKDDKGWYVETESFNPIWVMSRAKARSFYDHCLSKGQKIDKQKGFLIKDTEIYFRWRMHRGDLLISHASSLESTDGLPEELDILSLFSCCQKSKKFTIGNNIKIITIDDVSNLKISGNGCKNVIIPPNITANVTVPNGVKIHRPQDSDEYISLLEKFT